MEEFNAPTCEHANELIAFLYGELNDVESQAFQNHMRGCDSCSGELAAFSNIRRSVTAWRNESLGGIFAPASLPYAAAGVDRKTPSAMAALREFFDLSPFWMKGAVACATLLFCLFAGLAVANLRKTSTVPVASNSAGPNSTAYSDQQLKALVDQRVQDELQRIKKSTDESPASQVGTGDRLNSVHGGRSMMRGDVFATNSPARRPLSKVEREQLAADLRLVAVNNDSELDLLDDRINQ